MRQSLRILARYNQIVNKQLLELLAQCTHEQLTEERGVYFKSIIGLLNHILNSDRQWLVGLSLHAPETVAVVKEMPQFDIPDFMAVPFPHLDQFCSARIAMDESIARFVEALSPQRMNEYFEHHDWKGEKHALRFGSALLHLFNHHTHHRGQISALLDQMGIEHDWSNLIFLLSEIDPPDQDM